MAGRTAVSLHLAIVSCRSSMEWMIYLKRRILGKSETVFPFSYYGSWKSVVMVVAAMVLYMLQDSRSISWKAKLSEWEIGNF